MRNFASALRDSLERHNAERVATRKAMQELTLVPVDGELELAQVAVSDLDGSEITLVYDLSQEGT